MASNTSLGNITPKLLAQGLVALRENAIMPRLVNVGYSPAPGERGSSVDVPIPSAVTATDVAPGPTPAAGTAISPTKVNIPLDQWKEAKFELDDKERQEIMDGYIPRQATEAIKALANAVDQHILSKYKGIYGFGGTAGTTPFASNLNAFVHARREMHRNLCPPGEKFCVIDEDAEANATLLTEFLKADERGDQGGIINGVIGHKLGADWHLDQNVTSHTAGTLANGASAKVALVTTALAAGAATIAMDHTTLTGTLVEGDVLTFANHSGTYVVTNSPRVTASGNEITGVTISPALREAVPDNTSVTVQDDHTVNLLFHPDCFALATRPLLDTDAGELGNIVMAEQDPVSGLTLRLEVSRQNKQTQFSFDILYGAALVRAEFGSRILG